MEFSTLPKGSEGPSVTLRVFRLVLLEPPLDDRIIGTGEMPEESGGVGGVQLFEARDEAGHKVGEEQPAPGYPRYLVHPVTDGEVVVVEVRR